MEVSRENLWRRYFTPGRLEWYSPPDTDYCKSVDVASRQYTAHVIPQLEFLRGTEVVHYGAFFLWRDACSTIGAKIRLMYETSVTQRSVSNVSNSTGWLAVPVTLPFSFSPPSIYSVKDLFLSYFQCRWPFNSKQRIHPNGFPRSPSWGQRLLAILSTTTSLSISWLEAVLMMLTSID